MSKEIYLFIDQGTDYSKEFTLDTDLTNATLKSQIRKNYTSGTLFDFDIEIIDQVSGHIRIKLGHALTEQLQPTRYVWDLFVIDQGGNREVARKGTVVVNPTVTEFNS